MYYDEFGNILSWDGPSIKNDFKNFMTKLLNPMGDIPISEPSKNSIRKVKDLCLKYKVNCSFIILPYFPPTLSLHYNGGSWNALERSKNYISSHFKTYDFTEYNNSLMEKPYSNNMKYWYDVNHFKTIYGKEIINKIINNELPFGVILNKNNIKQNFKKWRKDRDDWIERNFELNKLISEVMKNKKKTEIIREIERLKITK